MSISWMNSHQNMSKTTVEVCTSQGDVEQSSSDSGVVFKEIVKDPQIPIGLLMFPSPVEKDMDQYDVAPLGVKIICGSIRIMTGLSELLDENRERDLIIYHKQQDDMRDLNEKIRKSLEASFDVIKKSHPLNSYSQFSCRLFDLMFQMMFSKNFPTDWIKTIQSFISEYINHLTQTILETPYPNDYSTGLSDMSILICGSCDSFKYGLSSYNLENLITIISRFIPKKEWFTSGKISISYPRRESYASDTIGVLCNTSQLLLSCLQILRLWSKKYTAKTRMKSIRRDKCITKLIKIDEDIMESLLYIYEDFYYYYLMLLQLKQDVNLLKHALQNIPHLY